MQRVWEEGEKESKEEISEEAKKAEEVSNLEYPGSILVPAAGVFQEKAREQKQLDMTNRIKEGLASGLKVLDDAFEALEMSPEGKYICVCNHVHYVCVT